MLPSPPGLPSRRAAIHQARPETGQRSRRTTSPPSPAGSGSPGGPVRKTCRDMCVGVGVRGGPGQSRAVGVRMGGQATPLTLKATPLPAGKAPPRGRACVSNAPFPAFGARAFFPTPGAIWQWLAVRSGNTPVCQTHVRCLRGRIRGNSRYFAVAT